MVRGESLQRKWERKRKLGRSTVKESGSAMNTKTKERIVCKEMKLPDEYKSYD